MSMNHGHRHSSIAHHTLDLITLNPFTLEDELPTALEAKPEDGWSSQDNHSRRSIESGQETRTVFGKHTRSRTEIDNRRGSNSIHPLRSAGLASGPNDAGITRPHLSRVLNVGTLVDAPSLEAETPEIAVEERDVLVHEINAGDSLAGVSLKYGISMGDLRRANHLWASDSIHLRTELLIPIDKVSRPIPTEKLISITPVDELPDPIESNTHVETQGLKTTSGLSHTETIRRVPASQLSFFPPSIGKSTTKLRPKEAHSASPSSSLQSRYVSQSSNSLTSLLTSLPIPASTRDTIIARLSFDSLSSSYSDRETPGDLHELEDVSHMESNSIQGVNDVPNTVSLATPKTGHCAPRVSTSQENSSPPRSHAHLHQLSGSPQSYIPPHPQVRTAQMEPSLEMQLPSFRGMRSFSKRQTTSRKALIDINFELENTNNAA
ncbi:hypothetical protein H0H81_001571 [Sphagnurus paluster]|uniref:LysM domain-containing protein n=1 Tax=Sphagnurus paluster TaxID=117069 RepID=A0A9P7K7S6_9AGAR|nr:hypothetical protein H0H81_001571 [Sphagnurus paluster]